LMRGGPMGGRGMPQGGRGMGPRGGVGGVRGAPPRGMPSLRASPHGPQGNHAPSTNIGVPPMQQPTRRPIPQGVGFGDMTINTQIDFLNVEADNLLKERERLLREKQQRDQ